MAAAVAPVQAEDAEYKINPWVDCGIGAMIFPNTAPGAVISNVIWDLGTTAVTSAGSSEHTCEGSNVKAAAFIQQSYEQIVVDTANGEGQHLNAMLELLSCDAANVPAIRHEMAEVVGATNYQSQSYNEKAEAYFNVVTNYCGAA
nr:DUF3015 family protein [Thaumasiovibrio subtropicus]